jgi:hypothetical protein
VPATIVVTSSWPLVVLVCPSVLDARWVDQLGPSFEDVFARKQPFALITDSSALRSVPAARERRLLADWAGRPDQLALQKQFNVGSSTIVKNAIMRGTLQALYWLWTPPAPQHAARDFDEAWTWCLAMLEKRSIPFPTPPREMRRLAERDVARLHAEDPARTLTPS